MDRAGDTTLLEGVRGGGGGEATTTAFAGFGFGFPNCELPRV